MLGLQACAGAIGWVRWLVEMCVRRSWGAGPATLVLRKPRTTKCTNHCHQSAGTDKCQGCNRWVAQMLCLDVGLHAFSRSDPMAHYVWHMRSLATLKFHGFQWTNFMVGGSVFFRSEHCGHALMSSGRLCPCNKPAQDNFNFWKARFSRFRPSTLNPSDAFLRFCLDKGVMMKSRNGNSPISHVRGSWILLRIF